MGKIISFVHISLDGFIAGPNGEMDWITINQEIFDHGAPRIAATDTAIYGRVTFQMMEAYWPTAAEKRMQVSMTLSIQNGITTPTKLCSQIH